MSADECPPHGIDRSPRGAVVRAWVQGGPSPDLHARRRAALAKDWPELARALHVLANTDERGARELTDDLYDLACTALEALEARNPAHAVDALRSALRLYHADLATYGRIQ